MIRTIVDIAKLDTNDRTVTFRIQEKEVYGIPDPEPRNLQFTHDQLLQLRKVTRETVAGVDREDCTSLHYEMMDVFGLTIAWKFISTLESGWAGSSIRVEGPFLVAF